MCLLTWFLFTLKEGLTPYNYAEQNRNSEMMRLLKKEQRNAERSNKSSTCVILWRSHLRMSVLLCRHQRETYCTYVFFLLVVQYGCVLHMREMLMRLFLSLTSMCWNISPVFPCIFLSINMQIVLSVFDCYILFIYSYYTQQKVIIYVIFLHNLFYNIVIWYTLLYNKLFISLMCFVYIIICYYVIIFLEEDPNQVILRVVFTFICLSFSRVVEVKNALLCNEKKLLEFIHNLSFVVFRRKLKSPELIGVFFLSIKVWS